MRSVIILEETSSSEPDVDEPWECVEWDADESDGPRAHTQAPTYAEILTSTA